jgi:hypothetical protein
MNSVSTIPWYAYTIMSFLPFFVGCIMSIAIVTYWKRMNMKSGGNPYSVRRQYRVAFLAGFACGCFCQYGLQEMGQFLLNIPPLTIKSTIVTGVFVAFLSPMFYDLLRGYAKRKGYSALYSFLTVRHRNDETEMDNDTTIFDITGGGE